MDETLWFVALAVPIVGGGLIWTYTRRAKKRLVEKISQNDSDDRGEP